MRDTLPIEAVPNEGREAATILAVGSPDVWKDGGGRLSRHGSVAYVAFHEVNAALLNNLRPETVVSPALARDFDCIDLAMLLSALRFSGSYKATAFGLPRPKLIEAEIAQLCPRLDFEIISEI
mgnify:FL=1